MVKGGGWMGEPEDAYKSFCSVLHLRGVQTLQM